MPTLGVVPESKSVQVFLEPQVVFKCVLQLLLKLLNLLLKILLPVLLLLGLFEGLMKALQFLFELLIFLLKLEVPQMLGRSMVKLSFGQVVVVSVVMTYEHLFYDLVDLEPAGRQVHSNVRLR